MLDLDAHVAEAGPIVTVLCLIGFETAFWIWTRVPQMQVPL